MKNNDNEQEGHLSQGRVAARSKWHNIAFWLLTYGPALVCVLGTAVFGAYGLFKNIPPVEYLPAIFAMLALIGASLLTERIVEKKDVGAKVEEISADTSQLLRYARRVDNVSLDRIIISRRELAPLEERLNNAKKVCVLGASLRLLLGEYRKAFEELAEKGCQLRFIMIDPESVAAEQLCLATVYEVTDIKEYRRQLSFTREVLSALQKRYPGVCEARLCRVAPPFSILNVSRDSPESSILVELYPFLVAARDRPILMVQERTDPKVYSFFARQFEILWESDLTCAI